MRVAISTNDGKNLTKGHFGDGEWFLIYEIRSGKNKLIEKRRNTTPPEDEHGSREKAKSIASILDDVHILLGFQFGPNIMRIKNRFLPVVSREITIDESLKIFVKHHKEIEKELHSSRGRVGILDKNGVKFLLLKEENGENF